MHAPIISHGYPYGFLNEVNKAKKTTTNTHPHPLSLPLYFSGLQFVYLGTNDYTPYLSLTQSLKFFNAYGPKRIMDYNHKLVLEAGTN